MRKYYKQALSAFFRHQIFQTRVHLLDITQEEMAHRIGMSTRSYVDWSMAEPYAAPLHWRCFWYILAMIL